MNGLTSVKEEGNQRKMNAGLNISNGSKMDSGSSTPNGSKMIPGFHRGSDTRDLLWYHFDTENRSQFRILAILDKFWKIYNLEMANFLCERSKLG